MNPLNLEGRSTRRLSFGATRLDSFSLSQLLVLRLGVPRRRDLRLSPYNCRQFPDFSCVGNGSKVKGHYDCVLPLPRRGVRNHFFSHGTALKHRDLGELEDTEVFLWNAVCKVTPIPITLWSPFL